MIRFCAWCQQLVNWVQLPDGDWVRLDIEPAANGIYRLYPSGVGAAVLVDAQELELARGDQQGLFAAHDENCPDRPSRDVRSYPTKGSGKVRNVK